MSGTNGRQPRSTSLVPGGAKPSNTSDDAATVSAAAGFCSPKQDETAHAQNQGDTAKREANKRLEEAAQRKAFQLSFGMTATATGAALQPDARQHPAKEYVGTLSHIFLRRTGPQTATAVVSQLLATYSKSENPADAASRGKEKHAIHILNTLNHLGVYVDNFAAFQHLIDDKEWVWVTARTTEAPKDDGFMELAALGRASLQITAVLATQAELNSSNWSNPALMTAEMGKFLFVARGTAANIRHVGPGYYGVTVPSVAARVPLPVARAISSWGFSSMGFHESFVTKSVHAVGASITLDHSIIVLSASKKDPKALFNHIIGEELSESSPTKPLFQ